MARVTIGTASWGDDLNADLDGIEAVALEAQTLAQEALVIANAAEGGRDPEFRISGDYLQYRLVGDTVWVNLTATSNLQGPSGAAPEIRVSGGWIQWRTVGAAVWNNLIATATLVGPPGSIADVPIYTSIGDIQTDILSGTLVDGDIVLLED